MMQDLQRKIKATHTQIPNHVMEALARIRISGEARQVLDAIMRKLYGFHKTEDLISLSQFIYLTGLSKPAICKAIRKLLDLKIITKRGNDYSKYYGINDYLSWVPLTKKEWRHITQKGNEQVVSLDAQKGCELTPVTQKDNAVTFLGNGAETITQKGNEKDVSLDAQKGCEETPVTQKDNAVTFLGNGAKLAALPKKVISVTQKGNKCYPKGDTQNKVIKESNKRKYYSLTSNEVRLSKLLADLIKERDKGFIISNLQDWALAINRLIRLNKRNAFDIEAVIIWSQKDSFWQNNILSTKALRKHFNQLFLKTKSSTHKTDTTSLADRIKVQDERREKLGVHL